MRKYFIVAVSFVAMFAALSQVPGCAVLGGAVAEKVAKAVDKYCEEPLTYRYVYRNTVNSYLTESGHVVHVHCSGDPARAPE